MIDMLASTLVLLAGAYLVGLGLMALLAPARTVRFLLGLAGSAFTHYLELLVRLAVGGAVLFHAPQMRHPGLFAAFGWVLVLTTACLLVVPWQWHRRFAQRAVPCAVRYLGLVAVASLASGGFVLMAVIAAG